MFKRFIWVMVAALCWGAAVRADEEIVVLSETPVAEFKLPNGSVLKNAYVWRRNSQGMMILHDDGNYFLNYKLLPPDWRAVYLGTTGPTEDELAKEEEVRQAKTRDPYKIGELLQKVPALEPNVRATLLERGLSQELDTGALMIGMLEALLRGERELAKRCLLFIEEKGYEVRGFKKELLFETCTTCKGERRLEKVCRACRGTGQCPKCGGNEDKKIKKSARDNTSSAKDRKAREKSAKEKKEAMENCTSCRGSGECRVCRGEGVLSRVCPTCRGAGQLLNSTYCENLRDRWVRLMNAAVGETAVRSVVHNPSAPIRKVLESLSGLEPGAVDFYFSGAYTNAAMDAELVMTCVMRTLVKENMPEAKRFVQMMTLEFPKRGDFEIDNYLEACGACKSTGYMTEECERCDGSGECPDCGGSGERKLQLSKITAACKTCKGGGECTACEGAGEITKACSKCFGRGRIIHKQRCEVRLELLVDALNRYYFKAGQ